MEAHFDTKTADLVILGQPNVENKTIDNPLVVPHAAELPGEPRLEGAGARTELVPRVRVADQHRAALLRLPHHGWTGHHLHGGDADLRHSALA